MPGLDPVEAGKAISRINHETGDLFAEVAGRLGPELSPADLSRWSAYALNIADTGWRSFEAVNSLLSISEALCRQAGSEQLLETCGYGSELTGYSFDPPLRYFEGVRLLLDTNNLRYLAPIESGGKSIHLRYEHASGLITDYFQLAFDLADKLTTSEFDDWVRVVIGMSEVSRDRLVTLLRHSRSLEKVSWTQVVRLQERSVQGCIAYISHAGNLLARVQPKVMQRLDRLILNESATGLEGVPGQYVAG